MDSLIVFFKKNTAAAVIIGLLIPIGLALLYGGAKSFWISRRNKKEKAIIYNFLVQSNAREIGIANDVITKATGVPKDRVIGLCSDHPQIEDAGKRQRSWKLKNDSTN
jgi:hypothetical protein